MIKQYKDKEWLEEKYIKEELSASQIGRMCGVKVSTIIHYLKKYGINCRSRGEGIHLARANHCKLSQKAIDWINGELLGDGSLFSTSIYSAKFRYGSKYKEYIQYVSDILNTFGIKQSGKIYERYHKDMDCYDYHYSSLRYVELLPIYKQWYPNNKKIVPKNIKLTPTTLRQHFIGDGCLQHRKNRRPRIKLSTCGFLITDVNWLVNKLINLGFYATRRKSDNTIGISSYSTKSFLDYIGECPVNCYKYKFSYQRR